MGSCRNGAVAFFHFLGLCSMLVPECCSLVSFIEVALMELCVTASDILNVGVYEGRIFDNFV